MATLSKRSGLVLLAAIGALAMAAPAGAQLTVTRWTVDGGGGAMQGGAYSLNGTIGQPDAGTLTGSAFVLKGGFWFGGLDVTGVDEDIEHAGGALPLTLAVAPNPVIGSATLHWDLPRDEHVRVGVYDPSGRQVAVLADETFPTGTHEITWRPDHLASGIYFMRLEAGARAISKKVLLVH